MNVKKITLLPILGLCFASLSWSQSTDFSNPEHQSNWKLESIFSLNITQASFTNWAAGGRNNISGLAFINANADYNKGRIRWANHLSTGLGGIKYFDAPLQKTDDIFDLQSTLSYGLKKPWYLSLMAGFRTQYLDGYTNIEDTTRSSTFLAPGYATVALGIEYIPNDNFKAMISPITGKFTVVNDQTLANEGAFGVTPAVYNSLGDVITQGEKFRAEIGAYLRLVYNKELMKNINLKSRLELFSNYLNDPQNIDVNAEILLAFKINKWFSATVQLNLIYDNDVAIEDRNGDVGPRTQFKEVIGVGIAYRLANFTEEKK